MMIGLTLLLVAVAGFISISATRDLFAPSKFFLLMFATFHAGILFSPYPLETWLLVYLVLAVGAATAVFETAVPPAARRPFAGVAPSRGFDKRFFLVLWLLTAGPVGAQIYMIQQLGGLEGYLNSIGLRVIEWRGLGYLKAIIGMLVPLNLVYLAAGLSRRRSIQWWSLYAIHLLLLLALTALTGSRSSFLNTFIVIVFVYHYVRKPLNPALVATAAAGILLFALVLGVARNNFAYVDGGFRTGLETSESIYESSTFLYGVTPLNLIVENGPREITHGATFLTVFTNFIPRPWWPDKPDTGGVVFTKVYTGDAWGGASNLTPTFLGEFIINFGWAGILPYLLIYPLMMFLLIRRYRTVTANLRVEKSAGTVMDLVIYLLLLNAVVGLMIGEFTNVVITGALFTLVPVFFLKWLSGASLPPKRGRRRAPPIPRAGRGGHVTALRGLPTDAPRN